MLDFNNPQIKELNRAMTEYSKLKDSPIESDSRCRQINLRVKVAEILYQPDFYIQLEKKVEQCIQKSISHENNIFRTPHTAQDLLQEFVLEFIDEYDHARSDNFIAYVYANMFYKVSNYIRKYNREHIIEISSEGYTLENSNNENAEPENYEEKDYAKINGSSEKNYDRLPKVQSAFVACVVKARTSKGNKNDTIYYPCFATGYYIELCKDIKKLSDKTGETIEDIIDRHNYNENLAFSIMNLVFSDHTLSNKCRKFKEICNTPLKTYGEIGISQKRAPESNEISLPFINSVYGSFLGVTDGAVSHHHKKFINDIKVFIQKK